MQHQSQGSEKELTAGETGAIDFNRAISSEEIERYIAAGKRMQSEAIAAFFKACFRRLGELFHQRSENDGQLSRA